MTPAKLFWRHGNLSPAMVAAGAFFLILICIGVAADVGLVLYGKKRPVRTAELTRRLTSRALPWSLVLGVFGIAIGLYLFASWLYLFLYPGRGIEPWTVIFQTLVFHLPVLILMGVLFHFTGIRWGELFGSRWKKAPALLGLSAILYLAVLPALWFCSALYQMLLQRFGYDFNLQDVVQLLMAPAPWPVRGSLFFIAILIAPAFEEIIFRGILLPFMVRRCGFWPGILLVSLIFGGMHLHLPSFLPLFMLSVAFSVAYARTQSLLVPIGMHALFNGVTIVLLLLAG